MLCGKPVGSYHDGVKVHFCRATKGRIVWALATARLSLGELSQLLQPVTMWFRAGQGEIFDLKEMLTFFRALRRLCHLSHDRLDMFIPAWIKMVIQLAETMDKCARRRHYNNSNQRETLRHSSESRSNSFAKDKVKNVKDMNAQRDAEIETIRAMSPVVARWMARMEAKMPWVQAVKELEEARNSGGLEASPRELGRLQAQVDEAHAAYQAFKANAREAGQS
ncbi:hypothetical protein COL922a_010726 [Colletotrichum nupharicola]|nr:hypothetical protein COL922a_010726 [Colletotrichum nupharicola]